MWIPEILGSAVGLGFYDVSKKHAVHDNAVMPVLFLGTACGTAALVATLAATGTLVAALQISWLVWWQLMFKSVIVTGSWICVYYAMRALPISIASPIRASQPLWTVLGAFVVFHEIPKGLQWAGIATVITGYALLSLLGRREGVRFERHSGILLIFLGTILGTVSGLYDKYLLQPCGIPVPVVQFWFSVDLVLLIGAVLFAQRVAGLSRTVFQWRWTIPVVGILLVASDWLYFTALSEPGAKISILSLIRRSNCVISFLVGGALFNDQNRRSKLGALVCILAGVAMLCLAR